MSAETAVVTLLDAIELDDPEGVRRAIAKGANINAIMHEGGTSLHFAIQWQHLRALEALIAAGAKIDAPDESGATPLMSALLYCFEAGVERLLQAGADPNKLGSGGLPPLFTAVAAGKTGAVKALLRHGAVASASTENGAWASDHALDLRRYVIARELILAGAPLSERHGWFGLLVESMHCGDDATFLQEAGDASTQIESALIAALEDDIQTRIQACDARFLSLYEKLDEQRFADDVTARRMRDQAATTGTAAPRRLSPTEAL